MQEQWYQLWSELPVIGRQWGGWLKANPLIAQGLTETFATSAASTVGLKWILLDQWGNAVKPVIPGFKLPGLGGLNIPGVTT